MLHCCFHADSLSRSQSFSAQTDQAALGLFQAPAVLQEIKQKFTADIKAAADGKYNEWIDSSFNGLALMIIMDQFTRYVSCVVTSLNALPLCNMLADYDEDILWSSELRMKFMLLN